MTEQQLFLSLFSPFQLYVKKCENKAILLLCSIAFSIKEITIKKKKRNDRAA